MAVMLVGAIVTTVAETAAVAIGINATVAAVGAMVVGTVVGQTVGGVINDAIGLGNKPAPSAVGAQQARGMLINAASSIDPLPLIYGSRKVGGTYVIPPSVSGASNEYLHLVIALCEGEISAINTVYLDDVASTDARFNGLLTIEKFLGTDTQAASADLISSLPGKWTSAHQGKGVAYLHVKILANQNAFSGLPVITADVDGKLVYDPRDGLTKFSNNAALCCRDYLTSTRYGRGIPAGQVNDANFIAAANHCDTMVSVPGGGTQKLFTCDGVVNVDDTVYINYQRLLGSCRGMPSFSGGKYGLVIDKQETPLDFTFNEDNITGAWEITRPGKRDKVNKVTASYFNPANNWQPDFAIQESSLYRTQDNGLLLERKIDTPFTADHYRAAHLAQLEMKATRFGTVVRFSAFQEGLRCEVGDVVKITHSTPGWTDKPFRILTIDIMDIDNVTITAREYDDAAYTLDALNAVATAPQSNLPNLFYCAAPSGVTLTSGTSELLVNGDGTIISRIKASWTAAPDTFARTYVVEFKKTGDTAWQTALSTSNTTAWVSPVIDGAAYDVRVCAENTIGVRSSWATANAHTVVGKTAPPGDVTGFNATIQADGILLKWNQNTDNDLAEYEVRQGGTDWASSTFVARTKATEMRRPAQAAGSVTWRIKAVDTSKNLSVNAAAAQFTINSPKTVTITNQVIDNNILLYWTDATNTLPVVSYEIRKGATYATSTLIGTKSGLFTSLFETVAGSFTYWVTGIDSAGNYGTPASVTASMNQPPDFVLFANYVSTFAGTLSNAFKDGSTVVMPVNTTETFAQHFTSRGWTSPQDQINAGYAEFIEPMLTSGYYEETIDYGTTLASSKITVTPTWHTDFSGSPTVSIMISTKLLSGDAWTDVVGSSLYATNFRYVKVRVTSTGTDKDVTILTELVTRLDLKQHSDSGMATCVSTDTGGTQVNFNVPFLSVTSIVVSPQGTGVVIPVYDFAGGANPTGFKILLFNSAGARVSGTASWNVKGY